jgi:hypothetical protein
MRRVLVASKIRASGLIAMGLFTQSSTTGKLEGMQHPLIAGAWCPLQDSNRDCMTLNHVFVCMPESIGRHGGGMGETVRLHGDHHLWIGHAVPGQQRLHLLQRHTSTSHRTGIASHIPSSDLRPRTIAVLTGPCLTGGSDLTA